MPKAELPHAEFQQFQPDLREVLEDLVVEMPEDSWRIERVPDNLTNGNVVAKLLRSKPGLIEQFLPGNPRGRRLRVVSPNTLVIGLFNPEDKVRSEGYAPFARYFYPHPIRAGLFSLLVDERYDPDLVMDVLQGSPPNLVSHERIDLRDLTGRARGDASLILEKSYLQRFSVMNISDKLRSALLEEDVVGAYPLGRSAYFCAKGEAFLESYGGFAAKLGIKTNF